MERTFQRKIYIQYEPPLIICTLKSGILKEFKDVTMSSQLRLADILWDWYIEKRVESRPALFGALGAVFTIKAELPQVPRNLPLREIYKGQRPPRKKEIL